MMKKVLLLTGTMFSLESQAHFSEAGLVLHGIEHLLIALLLVPVAWWGYRRLNR